MSHKESPTIPKILEDDPERRAIETIADQQSSTEKISQLRLKALEEALRMPVLDEGSRPKKSYIYSQLPVSEKSNWLQLGPTAVPDGQTLSTYYYWPVNISALVTGRITSIIVHPEKRNIIYVGTALGGVWKTVDGGRNWVAKSDYTPSLGIGALVMDPNDHDKLYAGTGEGNIAWYETKGRGHPRGYYGCGILKTTDGGEKWELLGGNDNVFIGASFYRIAINPSNTSIIFAATSYGLYRSINEGQDWKKMKIGLPEHDDALMKVSDVLVNPNNSNIVYVAIGGRGIYRSYNANDDNPEWKELDIDDLDPNNLISDRNVTRISLDISKTNPKILYALMASASRPFDERYEDADRYSGSFVVDRFYKIIDDKDDGIKWKRILLPGQGTKFPSSPWIKDSIGGQGSYNLNVAVDPTNSDIVYLSGISLWKATLIDTQTDTGAESWEIRDIGISIHPDHHAFAFDPQYNFIIYAGSDGGIYASINGGETWSDSINEGLCITQFEFIDQHPTSDAIIFGGTQDNGTLQYRNSPAFYFSYYGDGGFVSIDNDNPNNIIRQYTYNILYHSERAGQRDSWNRIPVVDGLNETPPSLFYAPFTLDEENPKNMAFGSDRIFLDTNQGLDGWKTSGNENSIALPFLERNQEGRAVELVSAINFVNSHLIYAGTTHGKVIRAVNSGQKWEAYRSEDVSKLPPLYIWDVVAMPNDPNTIIVIMGGFGSETNPPSYIWRGTLKNDNNSFEWEDISGDKNGKLPSTPINALVIDDEFPNNMYIGTDIGVFHTSNKGKSWIRFSENLPICSVYDMRLYSKPKLLRIATHGRGIWERQLDVQTYNDVNLFFRNHLMDTGQSDNSGVTIAAFFDPLQNEQEEIKHNDILRWDMCPDIKIDSPRGNPLVYQVDAIDSLDYVRFESRLQHRNPKRGDICNIYVQVHNKGIKPIVENATIRLFYAKTLRNGKYPELPKDFWASTIPKEISGWKPIGSLRRLPEGQKTLTNTEPTILAWQWYVPADVGSKVGLLVVVDSPEDPITPNNKILNVERLVKDERHVGLKTISIND
jgi:photosystem II stability/assembly factor-like uncharacterized protein